MKTNKMCNLKSRAIGDHRQHCSYPSVIQKNQYEIREKRNYPSSKLSLGVDDKEMKAWDKLRGTFEKKHPVFRSNFGVSSTPLPTHLETEPQCTTECIIPVCRKESSAVGVQVDLFHCHDCRRHIKYGDATPACSHLLKNEPEEKSKDENENSTVVDEVNPEDVDIISPPADEENYEDNQSLNSSEIPDVIKELFPDDEDKMPSEPKDTGGFLFSLLKILCGRDSPIANLRLMFLILGLALGLSLITDDLSHMFEASYVTTAVKETPSLYQRTLDLFFSTVSFPKTDYHSYYYRHWFYSSTD